MPLLALSGSGWRSVVVGVIVDTSLAGDLHGLQVMLDIRPDDGPRVLANMAVDRWMPTRFASLSDRLVTQNGVLLMGAAALLVVLGTSALVNTLVVLYSINVFITFSLSMVGM